MEDRQVCSSRTRSGVLLSSQSHSVRIALLITSAVQLTRPGMSEMATYLPISSPFIRFADRFVDEAFGVAAGYNFFFFQASLGKFSMLIV